jgi:DNA-binding CsgD family transcriptional regulator
MIDNKDIQIIQYLSEGLINKQIGNCLNLNTRTIEKRIALLKEKYECMTIAHLVAYSIKNDII